MKTLAIALLFSLPSFATTLYGQFVQNNKTKELGYQTFFLYEKSGEQYALPVHFESEQARKNFQRDRTLPFVIDVEFVEDEVLLDGQKKKISILKVKKAKAIDLSRLALAPSDVDVKGMKESDYDPQGVQVSDQVQVMNPQKGGLVNIDGVNDKVTNTIIGLGAAATIASILFN